MSELFSLKNQRCKFKKAQHIMFDIGCIMAPSSEQSSFKSIINKRFILFKWNLQYCGFLSILAPYKNMSEIKIKK